MEFSGSARIEAERGAVWAAVTDPETLKVCIPGCSELTGSIEDGFEATVVQKIGPVKATFRGSVSLTDIVEGESCVLAAEGKSGAAGFAKGTARVSLSDIEGGTELNYTADARVGGKLAQIGSRLVIGAAKKVVAAFFERFRHEVASR